MIQIAACRYSTFSLFQINVITFLESSSILMAKNLIQAENSHSPSPKIIENSIIFRVDILYTYVFLNVFTEICHEL